MRALLRVVLTVVLFAQLSALGRAAAPVAAQTSGGQYCSSTAASLLRACGFETDNTYWTTIAKCTNLTDAQERAECVSDAQNTKIEGSEECQAQYATRLAACRLLGEDRYDPDIEPSAFERNYSNLRNPNRYFPLTIGNRWEYRSPHELNTVFAARTGHLRPEVLCAWGWRDPRGGEYRPGVRADQLQFRLAVRQPAKR